MRRILCLLSVILVLAACAVPAFAFGGSEQSGTVVYAPALFDEWYTDSEGGPYEWLFNFYRASSASVQRNFSFSSPSGWEHYYGYIITNSREFEGVIGVYQDDFTLVANNKFFRIEACDNYTISFNNALRIKSIRLYGSYLVANRNADGQVVMERRNFDYTHQMGSKIIRGITLGTELRNALSNKVGFDVSGMFFEKLSLDFACEITDVDTPYMTVIYPRSSASSVYYDFRSWVNHQLSDFDTDPRPPQAPIKFDIGTFLGDSVSAFMSTPIFNEFTFGHLFGIVLTLGVLFFALKLLV